MFFILNNEFINPYHALGPVSYFDTNYLSNDVQIMYRFNCIAAGDNPKQPSNFEYNEITSYPVGLKKITDNYKCYIFAFPFAYMQWEQINALLLQLLDEIEAE